MVADRSDGLVADYRDNHKGGIMNKVLVTVWKCTGTGADYQEHEHHFWYRKDYTPQMSMIQKILNILTVGRI